MPNLPRNVIKNAKGAFINFSYTAAGAVNQRNTRVEYLVGNPSTKNVHIFLDLL